MPSAQTFHFQNETIQSLLLEMGQQRSPQTLFQLIVGRLAGFRDISLARIWLLKDSDICASCPMTGECLTRDKCLHLVASAGHSDCDPSLDWTRLGGDHKRFPVGARKVGHIAATGKPVVVQCIPEESRWIAHLDWARREKINGFAGQPMKFKGRVLGVLAIFTKPQLTPPVLDILRIIADHAASALANAQAFEEIELLRKQLKAENECLRRELSDVTSYGGFIGRSMSLQRIISQIDLVASTNASVLILGESGTGKELVAREVHNRSTRSEKALIKVNCASIPNELFASEFFGHAKGAFTGALANREGKFGAAHGGTLFLDEIGEIPSELQSQLLRVLQEGEYERVGEERTRTVDTRIIAATNRDLEQEVAKGRFRQDLYFRLNVFPITVPPLRERKEDIAPLANHFLARSLTNMNRPPFRFNDDQVRQLNAYHWPGNVRELQNIVERFAISTNAGTYYLELPAASPGGRGLPDGVALSGHGRILTEAELERLLAANIANALRQCNGKIYGPGGAAELLGVKPTTLATRIRKLNLR